MMGRKQFFLLDAPARKIKIYLSRWPGLPYPHNIVDRGRQPTSDHRSFMAFIQMSLGGGRFALGGRSWPLHPFPLRFQIPRNTAKMKGIWGENGCSGRDRPPRANRRIWHSSKWYWWMADEAPVVICGLSTMLWGSKRRVQVIVPWFWACFQPIISWSHEPMIWADQPPMLIRR